MAITMINPAVLKETSFFKSHCWDKLKTIVFCAVMWHEEDKSKAELLGVKSFDMLDDEKLIKEHAFIKEKDILDESYINSLQTDQQKEIAHQINRRTEFQVLRTDYESE